MDPRLKLLQRMFMLSLLWFVQIIITVLLSNFLNNVCSSSYSLVIPTAWTAPSSSSSCTSPLSTFCRTRQRSSRVLHSSLSSSSVLLLRLKEVQSKQHNHQEKYQCISCGSGWLVHRSFQLQHQPLLQHRFLSKLGLGTGDDDGDDGEDKSNNDGSNKENGDTSTEKNGDDSTMTIMECTIRDENEVLKKELFQLAASYDRGFGSSPKARIDVMNIIEQLERRNLAINPALSILNTTSTGTTAGTGSANEKFNYSLRYKWRMIWTTAIDVLSLQASPFFTVGAIYQCFTNLENEYDDNNSSRTSRVITNIIDFLPRFQSLLPPNIVPNTLIRAKVRTVACQPSSTSSTTYTTNSGIQNKNRRIGLVFEAVAFEPIELFGVQIGFFPPIRFELPKVPESLSAQGYFDVTYLDDEILIIRQNSPGGLFVLTKVDSIEP